MKRYIIGVFLLIYSSQLFSQTNSTQDFIISFIDFEGNITSDDALLKTISGLQVGQRIKQGDGDIESAIKKLWKQGLFDDVSVEVLEKENRFGLVFNVSEAPRLKDFKISGLKNHEVKTIQTELQLRKGVRVNHKLLGKVKHGILNKLKEDGYYQAVVELIQEKDDGYTSLHIDVDKRNKFKVSKINFSGNSNYSNRKLKMTIKSVRQKGELSFNSRLYGPNTLHELKEELTQFYNNSGYIDFEITQIDTSFNSDKNEVNIHLNLSEGVQYLVTNVSIEGNNVYGTDQLLNIVNLKKGDVFQPDLLNQRLSFNPKGEDISGLYMDNGYLFFDVKTDVIPVDDHSVDIKISIKEGPLAIIDHVNITGNSITNEKVLLREITTMPGNVFRRSDVMRSQSNLAMLGFLDPENINLVPTPKLNEGKVDLEYQVAERPNDRIELSGTWGAVTGLTGSLGFTMNNFAMANLFKPKQWNPYPNGNGEKMALRFQSNGTNYNSYSINYSNPWIVESKPVNLFTSIIHTRVSDDVTEELEDGTEVTETEKLNISSFSIGLARRMDWSDRFWTLSNSISLRKYTFTNYENALGIENGETYNFTLNTTLSRNNLNHPFYPTSGSNLSMSLSLTPPYSLFSDKDYSDLTTSERYRWSEYFKLMMDYKHHQSITGKLVLKTGVHFGLVNNYSSSNPLGPFERFQMGGSGLTGVNQFLGNEVISLRGYPDEALVPTTNDGLEGGTIYNKVNFELRYPVVLSGGFSAYLYGFAEAGNTWGELKTYDPFNLYKSAGFGAQFNLPMMGQLGVNWGYGFDKLPGSSDVSGGNFQFTLGIPIR